MDIRLKEERERCRKSDNEQIQYAAESSKCCFILRRYQWKHFILLEVMQIERRNLLLL